MGDRLVSWFWGRVGHSTAVPADSLRVLRVVIGVYLLVLETPHYAWIDRVPDSFFDPPHLSLGYLIGGFPPGPFFLVLDLVALAALVFMTLGIRARAATAVVVICRLIGTSFLFSFGKIDHTIVLTVVLALMAYCNWGEALPGRIELADSPDQVTADGRATATWRSRRALALAAVVVTFGFATAGLPKLVPWVDGDTSTSGILSWYYGGLFDLDRNQLLADWLPNVPLWLLELGDVAAVALELLAFAALLAGRVSWRVFLLLVAVLHLVNVLVLNIEFTAQAITYLAFVDLSRRFRGSAPAWARGAGVAALAVVVGWHVQARMRERGSSVLFVSAADDQVTAGLYIGVVACCAIAGLLIAQIMRERAAAVAAS